MKEEAGLGLETGLSPWWLHSFRIPSSGRPAWLLRRLIGLSCEYDLWLFKNNLIVCLKTFLLVVVLFILAINRLEWGLRFWKVEYKSNGNKLILYTV